MELLIPEVLPLELLLLELPEEESLLRALLLPLVPVAAEPEVLPRHNLFPLKPESPPLKVRRQLLLAFSLSTPPLSLLPALTSALG
jgi:hypothetical protein